MVSPQISGATIKCDCSDAWSCDQVHFERACFHKLSVEGCFAITCLGWMREPIERKCEMRRDVVPGARDLGFRPPDHSLNRLSNIPVRRTTDLSRSGKDVLTFVVLVTQPFAWTCHAFCSHESCSATKLRLTPRGSNNEERSDVKRMRDLCLADLREMSPIEPRRLSHSMEVVLCLRAAIIEILLGEESLSLATFHQYDLPYQYPRASWRYLSRLVLRVPMMAFLGLKLL